MKKIILILFTVLLSSCLGPSHDCDMGEAKCVGSTAYNCNEPGDGTEGRSWNVRDCSPESCEVTSNGDVSQATCTSSSD